MRKIQAILLVTLLVIGFCLVPPVNAKKNVYFHHLLDLEGAEIDFKFWFDATVTKPTMPFGGSGTFRIDLQPEETQIRFEGETYEGIITWEGTFDTAPVGEENFRFEVNEDGIEAIILGVDAVTYAKVSSTGRFSTPPSVKWEEAGTKSFVVTGPIGVGSEEIRLKWHYEWKLRFGIYAQGITVYSDWVEMDNIEGSTAVYDVGYGFGFLLIGLVVIVAIPVALFIRRRRMRKLIELEEVPEPEPLVYCRSCGSPMSTTDAYCNKCGAKV